MTEAFNNDPVSNMPTEDLWQQANNEQNYHVALVYACGAVAVALLGAFRVSRCTRITCGCCSIERKVPDVDTSPRGD